MKKFIVSAILAFACVQVQAQVVSSRASKTAHDVVEKNNDKGWSTFGVEYLIGSFKTDAETSKSNSGIAVNYTHAFKITKKLPLFIESGIGAQYSFKTDEEMYTRIPETYDWMSGWVWTGRRLHDGDKLKIHYASIKVPLNIIYDINIRNTDIHIDPYVGLRLRGNIWGEEKLETDYDDDKYDNSANLFGDEGGSRRFQVGWNVGVKARFYNTFFVGIGYGSDFTSFDIDGGVKFSEANISLGVIF